MRNESEPHETLTEALGPPRVDIAELASVDPSERDVYFQELLEDIAPFDGSGPDWKKTQNLLTSPEVRDDPVLARYAVRVFLTKWNWMMKAHDDALEVEGVEGSALDDVFTQYLPLAKSLRMHIQEMQASPGESGTGFGIEIEAMNNETMEIQTPATRNPEQLISYVDELDDINRQMRGEIQELGQADRPLVGVYDNVHINVGIKDKKTAEALIEDVKKHRGPYQLLTTLGLIGNSIGRMQYFAERWWDQSSSEPVSINEEDVELGDYARLQNRLWSFSLDRRNRPAFELVLKTMAAITEGYGKDPVSMRERLEEANEDIIQHIQETDAKSGRKGTTTLYSELFDVDPKSLALLASPERIAAVEADAPSLPGRSEMFRFAMHRIAELLPEEDARALSERVDDTLASIDELLAENENLDLSVDE